ncbi:hypothetical protein [Dyella japonica]|uniref:Uncharacterized protein n=1 Tax=Dyella japonica A8 TaxID=1217721 RepID=A0A075K356_9GAMM|nr:hypothetical protein [Dyella japonica]AIF48122.1 hypothetical protein HY57_13055 [Dyella japonica A8]
MSLSRGELSETFNLLEVELTKLEVEGQPEEALWDAFERMVQMPSLAIDQRDRVWWWEQVYSMMERHSLTELSRRRTVREFP